MNDPYTRDSATFDLASIFIYSIHFQYKRVRWEGWRPYLEFEEDDDSEKETSTFDAEAMKYLRIVLIPILLG